ncbi:MAG: GAF domain-containing protein [Chloroflexi bacterium]|nr:GAF domain-containing protein [Chloroflexota bacterium]
MTLLAVAAALMLSGLGALFLRSKREKSRLLRAEAASRQSEQRFRAIFAGSKLGTALLTLDGSVVDANPALAAILGFSLDELRTRRLADLLSPEETDAAFLLAATDASTGGTHRFRHRDGHLIWGHATTSTTAPDGAGNDYILLMVEDRTEATLAEMALQRSADEQAAVAEIGGVVNSSTDLALIYPRFADAVRKLLPWDRLSLAVADERAGTLTIVHSDGVSIPEWSIGESVAFRDSLMADLMAHPAGVMLAGNDLQMAMGRRLEYRALHDAGLRTVLASPLICDGRVIGAMNLCLKRHDGYSRRDIPLAGNVASQIAGAMARAQLFATIRHEAEERRVLAEIGRIVSSSLDLAAVFPVFAEQVRRLVEFDRIVVTSIDIHAGKVTDLCVLGVPVTGFGPGEAHRLSDSPLQAALSLREPFVFDSVQASEETSAGIAASMAAGLHSTLVAPLISNDQMIGTLNLKSRRPGAYGEAQKAIASRIASQIAGAVAASQLYAQAVQLAEERELRAKLEAEKKDLERLNEVKSEILSTVSHELKTPLATILGFVDVIVRNRPGNLLPRQVEQLTMVQRNARRLAVLIGDLVDVSTIEAGRFDIDPSDFDISELLREVANSFEPILSARGQRLSFDIPDRPVWISADRERLAQVANNILSNASKYSAEGALIDFQAVIEENSLLISVSDRGIGISSEDQNRLFTPFFRARNEITRFIPGTGLGLVISKRIVDLHGGTISVESTEGEGTVVTVCIPGVVGHPVHADRAPAEAVHVTLSPPRADEESVGANGSFASLRTTPG